MMTIADVKKMVKKFPRLAGSIMLMDLVHLMIHLKAMYSIFCIDATDLNVL